MFSWSRGGQKVEDGIIDTHPEHSAVLPVVPGALALTERTGLSTVQRTPLAVKTRHPVADCKADTPWRARHMQGVACNSRLLCWSSDAQQSAGFLSTVR